MSNTYAILLDMQITYIVRSEMRGMELRTLRYFLEMAREQSMSRAAERLHVTQPTISRQLADLERELGVKLFERTSYGVRLTHAGQLLRDRAEDIVALADRTERDFGNLDELAGDVNVGAPESDSLRYFFSVVRGLRERHPGIHCNIFSGNIGETRERLERGILDFAIVMDYADQGRYESLRIPAADTWGVIVRKDDPLAKRAVLNVDELRGLPLICSRQWIELDMPQWFGRRAADVDVIATYNLSFNAFLMVREGMGYAVAYDRLASTGMEGDLAFVPLEGVRESKMFVIWRRGRELGGAPAAVLEALRAEYGTA